MTPTKILGWLLLTLGILIVIYSLFISYKIFTGESRAPDLFKIEEKAEIVQRETAKSLESQAEGIVREELQKQFQKMMPSDSIPQFLNLISWSMLAGILILGGAQLSSLGIKLIKIKK